MSLLGVTSAFYVIPAIYTDYTRLDQVDSSQKPIRAIDTFPKNDNKFAANAVHEIRRKAEQHMQQIKVCQTIVLSLSDIKFTLVMIILYCCGLCQISFSFFYCFKLVLLIFK